MMIQNSGVLEYVTVISGIVSAGDVFQIAVAVCLSLALLAAVAVLLDSRSNVLARVEYQSVAMRAVLIAIGVAVVQYSFSTMAIDETVTIAVVAGLGITVGFIAGIREPDTTSGATYGLLTVGSSSIVLILYVAYIGVVSQAPGQPQFTGIVLMSGIALPVFFGGIGLLGGALGGLFGTSRFGGVAEDVG